MEIPTRINILGVPYDVLEDSLEDENGYISPKKQVIVLNSNLERRKREQVFLHEVVHGILDQLCYSDLYENECLVQGLAIGLHQALMASDA